MNNTIIGIIAKPVSEKDSLWTKFKVTDEFRKIIVSNGAVSIALLPVNEDYNSKMTLNEKEKFNSILNLCDGFILQGGWKSGEHEIYTAKYAIENDIPILGTCCGFNNMLFAMGDSVDGKKDESHNVYDKDYRHDILIEENSKLFQILGGKRIAKVNSIHNVVARDENIKNFDIVAHSKDGYVEAIELKNKRFVLGVKWHPEIMNEVQMHGIFREFITAANKYHDDRNSNN